MPVICYCKNGGYLGGAAAVSLRMAPNRLRRAGSARGRQGPLFSLTPLRDRATAHARVGQAIPHFLHRHAGTGPTCQFT